MSTGHPYALRYTGPGKSPHGTFWSEDLKGVEVFAMWNVRGLLVGVGLSACVFALGAGTADARIICRGQFQIVDGQAIATPYCEDSNVAAVAREYGIAVSAREVRRNPGTKARVCRVIGHDNRVRSACLPYINTGKHRWW